MKKKIFSAFIVLFAAFCFVVNANATTESKAPTTVPEEGTTMYAVLDDDFDFSKIVFKDADGNDMTDPYSIQYEMRKIMLSTEPMDATEVKEKLGSNWFTAYCLDSNLKYPYYSISNGQLYFGGSIDFDTLVMMALMGKTDYYETLKPLQGFLNVTPNTDITDQTTFVNDVLSGTSKTVKISSLSFITGDGNCTAPAKSDGTSCKLEAKDILEDETKTELELTISKDDIMFDKYTTTSLNSNEYNHALWIIEHSYPTLTIEESLTAAGASYEDLVAEIKALDSNVTDSNLDSYLDNYVYSTVQYAIWNANGNEVDGVKLGSSLSGSEQLNKLYQWLIADRSEYTDYKSKSFNNKVTINTPASESELVEETKDYYLYGPYTVSYDMLSVDKINLSILNEDKTGISIVDENKKEISSITGSEKFYIKCKKSAKIANVSIKAEAKDSLTFTPATNRGRIYYAYSPLTQNLITGGKITKADYSTTVDLIYNPKTGVKNIAIIFAISIVAFSLGYLAISYKSKSVELN